jgi:hypothetical protein
LGIFLKGTNLTTTCKGNTIGAIALQPLRHLWSRISLIQLIPPRSWHRL